MAYDAPVVRLAATYGMMAAPIEAIPIKYPFAASLPSPVPVRLLVSYVHTRWPERRKHFAFTDWVMDSGAYSAFASGVKIDLQGYIDTCKKLLAEDDKLREVYSLDVIGDYKATLRNTERMWEQDVPAIPTYHIGEPESYLKHIAKTYPKIALGGMAQLRGKRKVHWTRWAFAQVWPKRIHGFAAGARDVVLACPWDSVDATSWETGPTARGRWKAFSENGSAKLSVRGRYSIQAEVEFYMRLQKEAQGRWGKVLQQVA